MHSSKQLRLAFLIAFMFAGFATSAQATPVTWFLQDWEFSDGSTASGSYVYDQDVGGEENALRWSDINITSEIGPTTYNFAGTSATAAQLSFLTGDPLSEDLTDTNALLGDLGNGTMTNAGGTIPLDFEGDGTNFNSSQVICQNPSCGSSGGPIYLVSGSITTIPEPSAAVLTALGLVGLASRRRRP